MTTLLYTAVCAVILALFLYSKLTPYKTQLTGRYLSVFTFCERLFEPVLKILRKMAVPMQVGRGIAVDLSQVILLVILLIVLKFI